MKKWFSVAAIVLICASCRTNRSSAQNVEREKVELLSELIKSNRSGHTIKDVILREGGVFEQGDDVLFDEEQKELTVRGSAKFREYVRLFVASLDTQTRTEIVAKWRSQDSGADKEF